MDFTFVCPTEIVAFSDRIEEFKSRNTEVIGVSTDSQYSHLAWINMPRNEGGIGDLSYPLVADFNKTISRDYGVLSEGEGMAYRGLFLIDKNGVIRHMVVNDTPIGRSVDEVIRVIDALTHFEQFGEVCPVDWNPGKATIVPKPEESKAYFSQLAAATSLN